MGVAGMEAQNDMTGFGMGNQMGTYPLAQEKVPTLGAKKIIVEDPKSWHDPLVGTRKELMLSKWSGNSPQENWREFQSGQLGDGNELIGYIKEVSKSDEPVLRNPGDRAKRNIKLNKKFDRGY